MTGPDLVGASEAAAEPSSVLFWETVNAYQRTAALHAAVDLEVFTAVGQGLETVEDLARRCQASQRAIRILCDYLTVIGFLTKEGGRYRLTADSAVLLDSRSPGYLGGILGFINTPELTAAFGSLTEVVRRGTTLMQGADVVDAEDPVWEEFARSIFRAAGFSRNELVQVPKSPQQVIVSYR